MAVNLIKIVLDLRMTFKAMVKVKFKVIMIVIRRSKTFFENSPPFLIAILIKNEDPLRSQGQVQGHI